jgi:biofilm protein TabA
MILDVLEQASRYSHLNRGFAPAFAFLMRPGLKELPVGRYVIDGENVYAVVAKEPGRRKEDALLETHERYIDIQLVLAGSDEIGWKPKSACLRPASKYDREKDIRFFTDEPDAWLAVKDGAFAVFFPEDAHMPLISSGEIHKVVVKVKV